MNAAELLDELRSNILRDVSDLDVDAETPEGQAALAATYLWTDATLLRYINEGYKQFARRTLLIKDKSTADVCNITLLADQAEYELDPRVLSVMSVTCNGLNLQRMGYSTLTGVNADIAGRAAQFVSTATGSPRQFTTDEAVSTLRLYPTPTAAEAGEVCVMRVARLPMEPLVTGEEPSQPEVPEQYHLDILEWAAWRALRNHDSDGENMNKASAHKKRFFDAVDEAKDDSSLAVFTPPQFKFNANYG